MKARNAAGVKTYPAAGKQMELSPGNRADFSEFMLERYRLGELEKKDKKTIQGAIPSDNALKPRLDALEDSDRELKRLYPLEFFGFSDEKAMNVRRRIKLRPSLRKYRLGMAGAAAVFLVCIFLPVYYFLQTDNAVSEFELSGSVGTNGTLSERAKGQVQASLTLFLKGEREMPLPNLAVLHEGSTVQLAYSAAPGIEHYGVIFSIDGRSEVTMHYPYRRGQSSLLAPGMRTLLNEAYILDDAQDFEVFAMLVSEVPLDTEAVLLEAKKIASASFDSTQVVAAIKEKAAGSVGQSVLEGCEVETFTVIKE